MTLREKILATRDRPTMGPISVPEWDVDVFIRTMPVADRIAIINATRDGSVPFATLAIYGIGDVDGKCIFTPEDAAEVGDKSPDVLARLGALILEHNKMRPEDTEAEVKN
jgi:hypothetical protein